MKKDDFKVYSNPNIRKKMKERVEEVTFELEIPDEDTITALFLSSPYFVACMRSQEMLYYPTDLSAEESLMAPLFSAEILRDFIEASKVIRMKEEIPLASLLHVAVEDEDGEQQMMSLFDGIMQLEFMKFFQTAVMVGNLEAALAEEFEDVFMELVDELEENGYLDQVIRNIAECLDDPEMLSELLFPETHGEDLI